MKHFSQKIYSLLLVACSLLLLNSCIHDSCLDLNCQNGATCSDDLCQCPPGYEGHECQYRANSRFVGLYVGHSKCEGFPQYNDTVEIFNKCNPDQIVLVTGLGNTAIGEISGICRTPEISFPSYEDDNVIVNPYVRVDANQLQVTVISINKRDNMRYMCEFEGRRVPGTDTLAKYADPRYESCF